MHLFSEIKVIHLKTEHLKLMIFLRQEASYKQQFTVPCCYTVAKSNGKS